MGRCRSRYFGVARFDAPVRIKFSSVTVSPCKLLALRPSPAAPDLAIPRASCIIHSELADSRREPGIPKNRHPRDGWGDLFEQLHPFRGQSIVEKNKASCVDEGGEIRLQLK